MNFDGLKLNYEALDTVGNQISQKGSEFQDLLGKIKGINADLQTYWEGSDASKYSTAVAQQAEHMQKLADTIIEISAFLIKVNKAYQEVTQNNASAINS